MDMVIASGSDFAFRDMIELPSSATNWSSAAITAVNIIGALLSAGGLYVGVRAWRAADRADQSAKRAEEQAQQAAKEARAALRKGDAAEDLRVMSEMAISVIGLVEDGKTEGAKLKARDLAIKTAHVTNRRNRFFSADAKTKFEKLNTDVLIVSRTLAAGGIPADGEAKDELLNTCYEVMAALTGESGRIVADIEREEE